MGVSSCETKTIGYTCRAVALKVSGREFDSRHLHHHGPWVLGLRGFFLSPALRINCRATSYTVVYLLPMLEGGRRECFSPAHPEPVEGPVLSVSLDLAQDGELVEPSKGPSRKFSVGARRQALRSAQGRRKRRGKSQLDRKRLWERLKRLPAPFPRHSLRASRHAVHFPLLLHPLPFNIEMTSCR